MTEEKEQHLRNLLTSEMVSRVTLAESINIIHNIAVGEVKTNLEQMSDEEKESALEELTAKQKEREAQAQAQETPTDPEEEKTEAEATE